MKYQVMKNELKTAAKHIRELKSQRKEATYGYVPKLERASFNFRCKHIAYCMLRFNTSIEKIERKVRDNDPNCYTIYQRDKLVAQYLKDYKIVNDEAPVTEITESDSKSIVSKVVDSLKEAFVG